MITIRDDITFEKPELRIREYCEIEVYRGYDDKHSVNDFLTFEDIENANKLYAMIDRYDRNESSNLLRQTKKIGSILAKIPDQDIYAFTTKDWLSTKMTIRELLTEFLSVERIGLAKTTKILHLKRPRLFPILDKYVMLFLLDVDNSVSSKNRQ